MRGPRTLPNKILLNATDPAEAILGMAPRVVFSEGG
jgi:hypothetical protein